MLDPFACVYSHSSRVGPVLVGVDGQHVHRVRLVGLQIREHDRCRPRALAGLDPVHLDDVFVVHRALFGLGGPPKRHRRVRNVIHANLGPFGNVHAQQPDERGRRDFEQPCGAVQQPKDRQNRRYQTHFQRVVMKSKNKVRRICLRCRLSQVEMDEGVVVAVVYQQANTLVVESDLDAQTRIMFSYSGFTSSSNFQARFS